MASGFTTAKRNAILTAEFKTATVYGALFSADPGDAGSTANEVANAYDYARTAITFGTDAAAGSIANTVALQFPAANGGDWFVSPNAVTHLGIATSNIHAAATLIMTGSLTASKEIGDGDQLTFAIGAITCSIAAQA